VMSTDPTMARNDHEFLDSKKWKAAIEVGLHTQENYKTHAHIHQP
jgi:hypothetical protein